MMHSWGLECWNSKRYSFFWGYTEVLEHEKHILPNMVLWRTNKNHLCVVLFGFCLRPSWLKLGLLSNTNDFHGWAWNHHHSPVTVCTSSRVLLNPMYIKCAQIQALDDYCFPMFPFYKSHLVYGIHGYVVYPMLTKRCLCTSHDSGSISTTGCSPRMFRIDDGQIITIWREGGPSTRVC